MLDYMYVMYYIWSCIMLLGMATQRLQLTLPSLSPRPDWPLVRTRQYLFAVVCF